jgi:hypothetical protein
VRSETKKDGVVRKVRYAATSDTSWEKLLLNWSGMAAEPEVKLICAVIASGIHEYLKGGDARVKAEAFIANDGMGNYCRAIGLSPEFVIGQMHHAADYIAEFEEKMVDASDTEAAAWLRNQIGHMAQEVD